MKDFGRVEWPWFGGTVRLIPGHRGLESRPSSRLTEALCAPVEEVARLPTFVSCRLPKRSYHELSMLQYESG